jgi:hypothetical protein
MPYADVVVEDDCKGEKRESKVFNGAKMACGVVK